MENIEIKIWFTDNVLKQLQFLCASNNEMGIIKCRIGSDGRKYLKNGMRRRKAYTEEKAERCYKELQSFLLDKESAHKKANECMLHLEIECSKGKEKSCFRYDEDNMEDVVQKLSDIFWKEFNEINYLDFLRPKENKIYVA